MVYKAILDLELLPEDSHLSCCDWAGKVIASFSFLFFASTLSLDPDSHPEKKPVSASGSSICFRPRSAAEGGSGGNGGGGGGRVDT